ncbi:hypothetical protein Tco_1558681, partial [Tanacetum coccineum]
NTDYWQEPDPEESPVKAVATSPPKTKKPTRERQNRMIQSDDAPRQITWTHEEEITALMDHQAETGTTFKLHYCWEILNDSPKWKQRELLKFAVESGGGSKRYRLSGSSSFNTEFGEASINLTTNVGDNDEDEVLEIRRPLGRDRASGLSSINDDALARLIVTEMTTREKEQRVAFLEIKRREVECLE